MHLKDDFVASDKGQRPGRTEERRDRFARHLESLPDDERVWRLRLLREVVTPARPEKRTTAKVAADRVTSVTLVPSRFGKIANVHSRGMTNYTFHEASASDPRRRCTTGAVIATFYFERERCSR